MADPVSATLMAVGTGLSAYGQYSAGQSAKAAGRYNRAAAEREAEYRDIQAGQEIATASHRTERIAQRSKEILAQQRAAAAAGGGSTQDASVVAIQDETVKTATLDQLLEMAAAEESAQQIRYSGETKRAEGRLAEWQGKQKAKASNLAAATTLISGGYDWYERFG